MEDFFRQLFIKLASYFLFIIVLVLIYFYATTGEFPPKIKSIKSQYQSLVELKQNYSLVMKNASERLKSIDPAKEAQAEETQKAAALVQLQKMNFSDEELAENIKQLRVDQARLQTQLDMIIQQNREILNKLIEKNTK